jgi:hypothetical protein
MCSLLLQVLKALRLVWKEKKINFKGLLCLDVPIKWNSKFKMLEGAEKCQSAIELMEELDGYYVSTLWQIFLQIMKIELVLRFFSSFSDFFMKPQYDFRGLCI